MSQSESFADFLTGFQKEEANLHTLLKSVLKENLPNDIYVLRRVLTGKDLSGANCYKITAVDAYSLKVNLYVLHYVLHQVSENLDPRERYVYRRPFEFFDTNRFSEDDRQVKSKSEAMLIAEVNGYDLLEIEHDVEMTSFSDLSEISLEQYLNSTKVKI